MFFRRAEVAGTMFICKKNNRCYEKISGRSSLPNCQACRLEKCKSVGMFFAPRNLPDFLISNCNELTKLICQLTTKDIKRSNILMKQYTSENIDLREMVEQRRNLKLVVKDPQTTMTTDEWTFIYTFSTTDFLLSLEFMSELMSSDKVRLIENFAYKASIAFYAMRSMSEKSDQLVTPDGTDGLPQVIVDMFKNSKGFCERLKGLLISKFIELKITNEELLLLVCVLFCNPAVNNLSENAKKVIASHQKKYCDSLLQLCFYSHQQSGPSRFMDLLSLCHVIDRNYEQLQSAAILCVLNKPDYRFPKIIDNVFGFVDGTAQEPSRSGCDNK